MSKWNGVGNSAETGAEVEVEISTGIVMGTVESKSARVIVTSWTLDWVRMGVHNTVP
jgi:hypothetical protein